MNANDASARWTFDRRINLGEVLSTLALVGTLGGYMMTLDKRVALVEEKQQTQEVRIRDLSSDVKGDLRDINGKLDKLMDRQFDESKRARP